MVQNTNGKGRSRSKKVSERVVAAVAEARDVGPMELPPLYDEIDLDALDSLFDNPSTRDRNGPSRVVFTLTDCEVTVTGDGEVTVTMTSDQSQATFAADQTDQQDEAETTLD